MARNRTAKGKIARKYGENIFGNPKFDKVLSKKPYGPGQHGAEGKRQKLSEYGLQLKEKQKAKYIYGVLERQFRNTYEKARKDKGITGENLLKRLECRLDTIVNRLGFAVSQSAARQLVTHKHVTVNGKIVNVPSYLVKVNDKIGIKEKSKKLEIIHESLKRSADNPTQYLRLDKENLLGELVDEPKREDMPIKLNEQLIIELYSK